MQKESAKVRGKLDWSQLLGFDQASVSDRRSERSRGRLRVCHLGAKVGGKPGIKTGAS